MSRPTVAVDLGGTHVRAALVQSDGSVHDRVRISTPRDEPTPEVLVSLMSDVRGALGRDELNGAVIGVPGIVDHEREQLMHAPNLPPSWLPRINEDWLGERCDLPVSLANDADLASVGEARFGAGKGARDVVYVTVSTGVGAGIVLGNRLMRGRYSGGEVGHTIVDRQLLLAGGDGTVEGIGSGTALARAMAAAGIDGDPADLVDLVRAGDEAADAVWSVAIEAVAIGIVNLCWLVSPEVVVIGGGVGMNGDLVLPVVERRLKTSGPGVAGTGVRNAELGDDAGLAGAAAWWEAIGRHG